MKKVLCLLLLISFVLGVSGCMNDTSQIGSTMELFTISKNDVLDYLFQKYGESFEITKFAREFNGNDGIYYRVVFQSSNHPEKGVLYCYAEGYGKGDAVTIDGSDCIVTDDYANVILQTQYAAALQKELGEHVLVKCRLKTPNRTITNADLSAGLQACLENTDLYPHLYVIVLADISERDNGLREAAEAYLGKYNIYSQNLYVGYQTHINLSAWEDLYVANSSRFERYVVDESNIEVVEFTAFSVDEGIIKSYVVKE